MQGNRKPLRSLENYKTQHKERAAKMGVIRELNECKTLTQARIILFGAKRKAKHRKATQRQALEG